jgi:DNA-binding SARP family transcriptional activator
MRRLPPYHVPRPRLTDRCAGESLVIVEAAGGYGKSVLGVELVDSWRAVGIEVSLDEGGVPAPLLAARMHAAVARAGFTEAAASALDAGDDHVGAVDAMIDALAGERYAIVLDDAHHALPDAGALIDHIATRLGGEQRLVVLARRLPEGAERLRRAEFFHLSSEDLALRADETLDVCRSGFGLDVGVDAAAALGQATGGWTAATVLAAARAQRTGEAVAAVAEAADRPDHPAGTVAALLEEATVSLGPAAMPLLALIARLPLLDRAVVDAATGVDGFFERATAAGVPVVPARGTWFDMPGPVRDHLATLAPPPPEALVRAAQEYARRDELGSALQLLLASGDEMAAAALLANAGTDVVESMDNLELHSVFERLGAEAVDAHPWLLYQLAYSCDMAALFEQRASHLERARVLASRSGDECLLRALEAERANDLVRDFEFDAAAELARDLLARTPADEPRTRARATAALGRARCWQVNEHGGRDLVALAEAELHLSTAASLYRELGMRSAEAGGAPYLAIWIDFARGHAVAALERLTAASALVADRPWRRGFVLNFCAEVEAELGRHDECAATCAEVIRIADQLDNKQLRAYSNWNLAISASNRGDADATLAYLRETERNRDTWWLPASGGFLADAADLLDRVGHTTLGREYLARAKAEPKDAEHLVVLAEVAIESRHGDPAVAIACLDDPALLRLDPREHWRVTLFRGYCAFRTGDHRGAGELAARAFEEAARLGQPSLPLIRERAISQELLGLAAETGHPAALALEATALPAALAVLGRFELTIGGRPVPFSAGQGARLLKLVTVSGGRINADRLIETIWPEVEAEAGRNRLRTVLNRLRSVAGDVLLREGDTLVLDPSVRVDAVEFHAEARRARSLASVDPPLAVAIARGAISRYRGELLPDDPYEDWAEAPRERARQEMLDLLDLCSAEAARRGDLDEVRRIVEQTIERAPHDDVRYVRAVTTLIEQGRRGEALAVIRRARAAFAEIGLDAPDQLQELEASILEAGTGRRHRRRETTAAEAHEVRRGIAAGPPRRRPDGRG